jgi:hypothetical protein
MSKAEQPTKPATAPSSSATNVQCADGIFSKRDDNTSGVTGYPSSLINKASAAVSAASASRTVGASRLEDGVI